TTMKMIGLCVTLMLFNVSVNVTVSEEVSQTHGLLPKEPGNNVTLRCFFQEEKTVHVFWFKQHTVHKPQCIAMSLSQSKLTKLCDEFKDNPRFRAEKAKGRFHLTISSTQPSDTTTYYCAAIKKNSPVHFGNGTFLKIHDQFKKCWSVVQQFVSIPVQPRDNVTFQCTMYTDICPAQHDIHWFRNVLGESFPKIINTNGSKSDQCEKSSVAGIPTQSCVYNLTKKNLSHSDSGTYYCAVASCGGILFGNGTLLEITVSTYCVILLYYILYCLGFYSLIIIATTYKNKSIFFSGNIAQLNSNNDTTANVSCEQVEVADMLNYSALKFTNGKAKLGRKSRYIGNKAVYAEVRY
uniref:Ig-like domain-containing protein n=1 Tax=Lepisosteus oculatus TaxID=7918 RepID=W5MYC0_LEPOC